MSSFADTPTVTHTTTEIPANVEYTITATVSNYTPVTQTVRLIFGQPLAVEIECYDRQKRGIYGYGQRRFGKVFATRVGCRL